ncbi:hypothetical protein H2202_000457 [Exophiala xenobiotica]|nr:hypothetical protein H2202_000457 [Exophiala xenobiotica]KAK5222657.1 hypothetical protein LTR72_005494 [Exophiala xenobiotica]KAK5233682.1 hypothetical protein LTR47_005305 [Exophiala xenobiotica]KAK5356741.1 hypothetical protein LTR61_000476 [Exophiala xenobiotica]KAK5376893.1 hypothetical protein LTR11_004557 [Exophiala xenobiotica]
MASTALSDTPDSHRRPHAVLDYGSLEHDTILVQQNHASVESSSIESHYPRSQTESSEATAFSPVSSQVVLPKYDRPHDHSSSKSASITILEKHPMPSTTMMPEKKYDRFLRNLRWTVLSVYRRLNILVLATNIAAMIGLATQHKLVNMSPQAAATAVSINILVGVLVRQELVINALFWSFGKCPRWFPLRIRRVAAKIYHLGGVHSGAGMSATLWFGFFNAAIVRVYRQKTLHAHQTAIPAITVVLDILLISILVTAHPGVRARLHNLFEVIHRFAGWTSIILIWVLFGLLTDAVVQSTGTNITIPEAIAYSPVFWTLVVTTISIALPWVWLRKVSVHAEPLSDHATRLHFTYTNLPLCAAPRLSDSPLLEWHAFAGIPAEDGHGFSVLVSKAGDWTSRLISSPPAKLWVRGIPTMGVLHVAPIFNKVVLVATGSGIGPVLSLLASRNMDCRILWSTPDPERTYKSGVIEAVRRADQEAIIINTTVAGRPDLVRYTYDLYVSSGAEACFIISNPRVTRRVVYGLESRGVPIFAPIFDS